MWYIVPHGAGTVNFEFLSVPVSPRFTGLIAGAFKAVKERLFLGSWAEVFIRWGLGRIVCPPDERDCGGRFDAEDSL
jgi:hypothetical protein